MREMKTLEQAWKDQITREFETEYTDHAYTRTKKNTNISISSFQQ